MPAQVSSSGWSATAAAASAVKPADEGAESPEQALLVGCQQLVAPGDRAPQRVVAVDGVARAGGQQRQATLQAVEQALRRERTQPTGAELDGQRQSVEAGGDAGDGSRVLRRDLEPRIGGSGAGDQERDRVVGAESSTGPPGHRRRHLQWQDRELLLSGDAERRPAGGEDGQLRRRRRAAGRSARPRPRSARGCRGRAGGGDQPGDR